MDDILGIAKLTLSLPVRDNLIVGNQAHVVKSTGSIDLSIIVAVYNENPKNLFLLLERLQAVLLPQKLMHEVIFVNDGSTAPTGIALREIANANNHVKLIELSRNFGQQAAITAGLDHSVGKAVVNIDSDLQDPPELIPQMVQKWKEGYEVVYAIRSTRRDRFLKRVTADIFYRVLASVSSIEIPRNTGDFRLMDRKVVNVLCSLNEKTRFFRGLVPWLGFKQCGIKIDRDARELGESSYTLRKLVQLSLDGILSFSAAPLYLLPILGAALIAVSLISYAVSLCAAGFAVRLDLGSVVCAFIGLTGLQLMGTGVVAVYLARVLDEVRGRPTYIVGQRSGRGFDADTDTLEHSFSAVRSHTDSSQGTLVK